VQNNRRSPAAGDRGRRAPSASRACCWSKAARCCQPLGRRRGSRWTRLGGRGRGPLPAACTFSSGV